MIYKGKMKLRTLRSLSLNHLPKSSLSLDFENSNNQNHKMSGICFRIWETISSIVRPVRRCIWNSIKSISSNNGFIKLAKALVYDLHVDENLKLNPTGWDKVILPVINSSDCLPSPFPDLVVFAEMSNIVYGKKLGNEEVPLPAELEGWSLLVTASSGGYFGAAFINRETRQVLVAHRGTLINSFWDLYSDVIGIWMNKYEPQMGAAMTFSARIAAFCCTNHYTLLFSGHSLGGWLAQISTFSVVHLKMCPSSKKFINKEIVNETNGRHIIPASELMPYTVVFDSPGASKMLCKMRRDFYCQYGRMDVKVKTLPIEVYVSSPNAVNRVHRHVGAVFQVKLDRTPSTHIRGRSIFSFFSLNVETHRMTGILQVLRDQSKDENIKLHCVRELPFYAWDLVNEPNTIPTYKVCSYVETVFNISRLQKAEQHFLQTVLTMRTICQDIGLFFQIPKFNEMMLDFQIENFNMVDTKTIHRFAFIPYVRWVVDNYKEKLEPQGIAATAYSNRTMAFLESLDNSPQVTNGQALDINNIKNFIERDDCQVWHRVVCNTSIGIAEIHGSLQALGMSICADQTHRVNRNSYALMDFDDFKVINNYLRFGSSGISLLVLECPNNVSKKAFSSWIEGVQQKIILVTNENFSVDQIVGKNTIGIFVTKEHQFVHNGHGLCCNSILF